MKVEDIKTFVCDAGWRNYYFLKITADNGLVGWSEFDEGFGSPGVTQIIEQLGARLIGKRVGDHERFFQEASALTRPAPGSVIGESIGALENALLDLKAKHLGVPCYELLGGKLRDRIRVYWSHCATWRINHPEYYPPAITSLEGVVQAAREVKDKGFTALKSNIFIHDEGNPYAWRPGFAVPFQPELNADKKVIRNIRAHLEALIEGAGPDVDILFDVNFNMKSEGLARLLREIKDLDLFWLEVDNYSPKALAHVRKNSPHPISSCETLFGIRGFLPYLEAQAIDVGIIDTVWNGVWQSMKIAAVCEAFDVNVAPHNFYGDLCTMMNVQFAAAVPNLRIMECDIDRLPWESELYTHSPEFENGHLIVPDRPGWGTDPIEEMLLKHPPKSTGGLLQYKKKN